VIKRLSLLLLLLAIAACSKEKPRASPEARERVRTALERADQNSIVSLVAGDTLHISPATREFYRRRRWRPAWANNDHLTHQGQAIAQALGRTEDDGLNPARYRYDVVHRMVGALDTQKSLDEAGKAKYIADVDMLLTEAFARYAQDVAAGMLDPAAGGLKWNIPRGGVPKGNLLGAVVRGADPNGLIQRIRPAVPQYGRLMKVLTRLQEIHNAGGWPAVPAGNVKPGDSSNVVVALRERLKRSEDAREAAYADRGSARPAFFDQDLNLALKHFQQRNGVEGDGALGESTLTELNRPIDERISEVKINMDRWRWLPHDLGRMYVLVNVAAYELSVVENNRSIMGMNVVVGQQGWETPIFADTLEDMVANPSWNVPPSIAAKEFGNLSEQYLVSHHFVRTRDGGYRQLPGPDNALGELKFEFPNKDNIYLHDTPSTSLFSRTDRAFSHGCIRVEHPRELAYLLGEKLSGKSTNYIDNMIASGSERTIRFRHRIPIYILYFTTWVDDDGTVEFNHDVYGQNEDLQRQTKKFEGRVT
jgi:murein L,D-transpeptidase YcbB/YkuD